MRQGSSKARFVPAAFLSVMLAAVFLRLFRLGTVFFNADEPLHQIRISAQPLSFVLVHNNGPLFSILVHFLLPLGRLEIMARLVSAAAGVGLIALIYALGKAVFSRTAGLIAAAFAAGSHLLVMYSQNSRTYSLTAFLSLLSLFWLIKAAGAGRTKDWVRFGLATALALYSHPIVLLVLPSYALYAALLAFSSGGGEAAARRSGRNILLWTAISTASAVVLVLPSVWVREFFVSSVGGAVASPAGGGSMSLGFVIRTIAFQITPGSAVVAAAMLCFAAFGFAAAQRRDKPSAFLFLAYMILPWAAVLVVQPRETTVHSLYRYLMFLLPPIFLLAGRGLEAARDALRLALPRAGIDRRTAGRFTDGLLLLGAAALAYGSLSSLGAYYFPDFWRQGAYPFDPEVVEYLRENGRSDSVLYIDSYPAASAPLMLTPLAGDIRPEEISVPVREAYVRPPESREAMIHVVGWEFFVEYVASHKIDLWAVTRSDPGVPAMLRARMADVPEGQAVECGRSVVLHFGKTGESAAEKLARLADILTAVPGADPVLERQRRLLAAKAFFMTRSSGEGIRELRAFEAIRVGPEDEKRNAGAPADRILGVLLRLDAASLRGIFEMRAVSEVLQVAFLHAGNLLNGNRLEEAWALFREILNRERAYRDRILDQYAVIAARLESGGSTGQAKEICREALRADPARREFTDRLAALEKKKP